MSARTTGSKSKIKNENGCKGTRSMRGTKVDKKEKTFYFYYGSSVPETPHGTFLTHFSETFDTSRTVRR